MGKVLYWERKKKEIDALNKMYKEVNNLVDEKAKIDKGLNNQIISR